MAKTCLKVIKASCFRLMSLHHLKFCMSRSWTAWFWRVSLAEHSHSGFALTVVCRFLPPLSLPMMPMTIVSGKSRLRVLDSVLEPIAGVELSKKVFTSRGMLLLLWHWVICFHLNPVPSLEASCGVLPLVTLTHGNNM
jgi:hypothetical protein